MAIGKEAVGRQVPQLWGREGAHACHSSQEEISGQFTGVGSTMSGPGMVVKFSTLVVRAFAH